MLSIEEKKILIAKCQGCQKDFHFVAILGSDREPVKHPDPRNDRRWCDSCATNKALARRYGTAIPEWVCEFCGAKFTDRKAKYCKEHRNKSLPIKSKLHTLPCRMCGDEFTSTYGGRVYCSQTCLNRAQKERAERRHRERMKKLSSVGGNAYLRDAPHRTGAVGECLFDVWALKQGWMVCRPIEANCVSVDRAVFNGKEWFGVQVKATSDGYMPYIRSSDHLAPIICRYVAFVSVNNGDVYLVDLSDSNAQAEITNFVDGDAHGKQTKQA